MSNKRELAERLELAKQFAPKGPLSDEEIIASVHAHLPNHHPFLPGQLLATLTSLTTTVDGVASLGFYTVYIYEPGLYGYNYVVIGSPYPDAWQTTPTAQIYLANALFPTRTDIVITCRIMGQPGGWPPVPLSITGSNLSPPVSQSFNVPGGGADHLLRSPRWHKRRPPGLRHLIWALHRTGESRQPRRLVFLRLHNYPDLASQRLKHAAHSSLNPYSGTPCSAP
jgi:hypothetical protein